MRIRTRLFILLFSLGAALFGFTGWQALEAWTQASLAERARGVGTTTDLVLTATGSWAIERGTLNGVLRNPAALTSEQSRTIETHRRRAEEAASQAWREVSALNATIESEAAYRAAWARVEALRGEAERALSSRQADPELADLWFAAMSDLIARAKDVALEAGALLDGRVSSRLLIALDAQRALGEAREHAGRERGTLNGIIAAGAALNAEQIRRLASIEDASSRHGPAPARRPGS